MPARAAISTVAATVVAPMPRRAMSGARSRRLTFATSRSFASRARSAESAPTTAAPSATAMVAGVAPQARTSSSIACAVSRFIGRGRPCAITVDSSATTGRFAARAAATSALTASLIASRGGAASGVPGLTGLAREKLEGMGEDR